MSSGSKLIRNGRGPEHFHGRFCGGHKIGFRHGRAGDGVDLVGWPLDVHGHVVQKGSIQQGPESFRQGAVAVQLDLKTEFTDLPAQLREPLLKQRLSTRQADPLQHPAVGCQVGDHLTQPQQDVLLPRQPPILHA